MRKTHKDELEKHYRKLQREYNQLLRDWRSDGTWKVVKPYQSGWFQSFVLRDDAKNRRDVADLQYVLALVNSTKHSHRKDFMYRELKTGKWAPIKHTLGYITEAKYQTLSEKHRSYFEKYVWYDSLPNLLPKRRNEGYRLTQEFYFIKAVRPAIVTEQWLPDGDKATRLEKLSDYFWQNRVWLKLDRLYGRSVSRERRDYNAPRFKFLNEGVFELDSYDQDDTQDVT